MMRDDMMVILVICSVMSLTALKNNGKLSFDIYKDYLVENNVFLKIEKICMFVLPIVIFLSYYFLLSERYVVRIWLMLVLLLDFAFAYLAKSMQWMKGNIQLNIVTMISWILYLLVIFLFI